MSETLRVHFSDAVTDVLVWLVDNPPQGGWATHYIFENVAPADAYDGWRTTCSALRTLLDAGLVEGFIVDGDMQMWRASDAGHSAVAEARSS